MTAAITSKTRQQANNMSNMVAKLIVVCLVLLLVCLDGVLSDDIAMISGIGTLYLNGTSWKMARKSCKDKGTKLYTVDTVQEWYDLTGQLNNSGFNSFWVGARGYIENWVWTNDGTKLEPAPIGCFAGGYQLPNNFKSNQPTLCMSFCRHFQKKNYAALKGEQCHCYDATSHFRPLSKEDCNFTCPGSGDKTCGGPESVTVFSTADSIHWSSEDPVAIGEKKDCAMMVRNRDNHTMWYSGDCQHKNAYICKIETNIDICKILEREAPCFVQQKESASWFEAARRCEEMGGHLAGKDIEGALHLNLGSQFYWTSLTRVSQRWTYGKDIDLSIPRSSQSQNTKKSCIAMQKIANESWVISPEPCRRVMPYLCRQVSTQPSPPYNSIDFRNDSDDKENEIEETYLLEGAHIFFIIIPSMFGILLTFSIVMLVLSVRRCKQREKKKREQKQHFYFVLEKEESIYNTIDCVDITREPVDGSTNDRVKCTKASRVGSIDHDNTYNKLMLKGRMANGWLNSDHVVRINDTSGMHESQYDHMRLGEQYDTIDNVRKHCIILAENPYDRCDATSNQCDVTSHKTFHIVGQIVPKEQGKVKTVEENIYDTADCDCDQSHSRENLIKHN